MTKTWITALAAVLGLAVGAHATEPPEFMTLPPSDIKVAPLPLNTKAPLNAEPLPAPSKAPTTTVPPTMVAPTTVPSGSAYGLACPCAKTCATPCSAPAACSTCNACTICETDCGGRKHLLADFRARDHDTLDKLWAWLTYCPCQRTPLECCFYAHPVPDNYTYFLWMGCHERDCGSCGCKSATPCGSCCGK